jgi:anti-sigma regulatory factor (Ser/Thr protein kinase)
MLTCLELSERAIAENVRPIRQRVARAATEAGASEAIAEEVALCVTEAVANVIRHAYDRGEGDVEVLVEFDDGELIVIVRDHGRGMRNRPPPPGPGGYGLRIIRALAHDVAISSDGQRGTVVDMRFALVASAAPRDAATGLHVDA